MRWNSDDGPTLDDLRDILAKTPSTLGSWYHSTQFTHDRVAVACNIPLDHWDQMSVEHQARTIEVWQSDRTMRNWIEYLTEKKRERERNAQS